MRRKITGGSLASESAEIIWLRYSEITRECSEAGAYDQKQGSQLKNSETVADPDAEPGRQRMYKGHS